jgi:hypothetical protein
MSVALFSHRLNLWYDVLFSGWYSFAVEGEEI